MGPPPPLLFSRHPICALLAGVVLFQILVLADWVDDVIEIVNQKMAPWHALLEKYERALATMESEERELSRIKQARMGWRGRGVLLDILLGGEGLQIIEKKIEMHQKKLKKLMLKNLIPFEQECKFR
uniref:Uncharacterized protein n=1 Tax=Globodera pallida TaxID=36090 RepID=A0A183CIZ7_GLOPA